MTKRGSGILLHITSLPSAFGIGDLGPAAYQFVDFLNSTKQKYWQILPLNPTDLIYGNSPYSSISAFGANTLMISPELLIKEGWLEKNEMKSVTQFEKAFVDYESVTVFKKNLFERAYGRFKNSKEKKDEYGKFCSQHHDWLDDYALYVVIKDHFQGQTFTRWPPEYRDRKMPTLQSFRKQNTDAIEKVKFLQYVFFQQWFALKSYCQRKGVRLIGDIPIYVNDDSVDVWTHPRLFKLDSQKHPESVAGVPPDYFSETGQRWGNPVYDWVELKKSGYAWWVKRIQQNLNLFDVIRIDHFRGFISFWEIPASEKTAVQGRWVEVPHDDFFKTLLKEFSPLPLVAEDLGIITPEVTATMERFKFPGMKVLLFAFGGDQETHPYLPKNYKRNCVVYTGTHDNNTAKGWFENEMSPEEKNNLFNYLEAEIEADEVSWGLIHLAMESVADIAITPLQDILGLGKEARMNLPGTLKENWKWRLLPDALTKTLQDRLLDLTHESKRS